MQGSLFIVHEYFKVKRVKIWVFHQKQLEKQETTPPAHVHVRVTWFSVQGHMRQQGLLSHREEAWLHANGRMRKPLLRKFSSF
jgi:hypothetical protein